MKTRLTTWPPACCFNSATPSPPQRGHDCQRLIVPAPLHAELSVGA